MCVGKKIRAAQCITAYYIYNNNMTVSKVVGGGGPVHLFDGSKHSRVDHLCVNCELKTSSENHLWISIYLLLPRCLFILIAAQQRKDSARILPGLPSNISVLFYLSAKLKKGLSKNGNQGSSGWPEKQTGDANLFSPLELFASAANWFMVLTHNSISRPTHPQRFWPLSSCVSTLPIMAAE